MELPLSQTYSGKNKLAELAAKNKNNKLVAKPAVSAPAPSLPAPASAAAFSFGQGASPAFRPAFQADPDPLPWLPMADEPEPTQPGKLYTYNVCYFGTC